MEGVCAGEYAVRHNPPPYYTTLSGCSADDVPYTQLATDLTDSALPAFSFITPNLIDDMHDGTIADGDTWLSGNLPTILNSAEYTSGTTAVFITWDEGTGGKNGEACATNTTDASCHGNGMVAPGLRRLCAGQGWVTCASGPIGSGRLRIWPRTPRGALQASGSRGARVTVVR
jgi:hypothetical protein